MVPGTASIGVDMTVTIGRIKTAEDRQKHRSDHKQRDGISGGKGSTLFLSGADRLCNHNGGTHRKSYDHDSQHMHDLTPDGNGGDMCDRIKLSDDKQIRHSVEGLQKV